MGWMLVRPLLQQTNEHILNSSQVEVQSEQSLSGFRGGSRLTRPQPYKFLEKRAAWILLLFTLFPWVLFLAPQRDEKVRRDKDMRSFLGDKWDEVNIWQTAALGTAPVCVAAQQKERKETSKLEKQSQQLILYG